MRLTIIGGIGFVAVLIALTSIWLLRQNDDESDDTREVDNMWDAQILEQASYQRSIVAVSESPVDLLSTHHEFEIANVLKRIDDDLFVFDYGPMLVYRVDTDGAITGTYGLGRGRDPGYFQHLTDVAVDESDGQLLIVDGMVAQLSFFSGDGEFRRRLHFPFQFSRAEPLNDRIVLMSYQGPIFRHVSYEGDEILSHGELSDMPLDIRTRDGKLLPGPDGGFIFVASAGGYLFYFTYDGKTSFIRRTIDRQLFSFESGDSRNVLSDGLISRHLGVHVIRSENRIQLVVDHLDDGNICHQGFVDAYELTTGTYIESIEIGCEPMNATFVGGSIDSSIGGTIYRSNMP